MARLFAELLKDSVGNGKEPTAWRDNRSTPLFVQVAPAAKTTSTTLTTTEILAGLLTGQGGAAVAYTLPLATDLETALFAAYPDIQVNDSFDFSVVNIDTTAANTITMTTNTGWTLVGSMVLPGLNVASTGSGSVGTFRARRTAANTYTLYRVA
jgi:hypothetical protein